MTVVEFLLFFAWLQVAATVTFALKLLARHTWVATTLGVLDA